MTRSFTPQPFAIAAVLMTVATLGACGGNGSGVTRGPSATTQSRRNVQPVGDSGTSSALALAIVNGRRVALIADEDAKAVLTFDVDAKKLLASTAVGGAPSQVYVARDGRVFVTVRETSKLVALGVDEVDAPLRTLRQTSTPAEPVAIAAS
ncbi:MAG TPA: hypothetical protein VM925_36560, partial [Labilithrix sp.]|nr:hypothetical protein [Labilithrix sp.]